jgi:MFS family permease
MTAIFASLRHPDYRRLFLSTSCAGLALWTLMVGRGWLAYHLTGSSTWVGVVTFAGFLPFLLGPVGGVLADRYERRRLAAASAAISCAFTIVLAVVTIAGVVSVWQVAVLTLLMSVPRAAELPARQALIPNVVPAADLLNAFSLSSVATFGTRAAGPALVIPLISAIGAEGVFFLAAGLYAVSALGVMSVGTRSRGGASAGLGALRDLKDGVAYIVVTPAVASLMLLVMFHCAFTMSFDSLLPVFAVQRLEAGSASFSALAMGVGGGALVGTVLISGVRDGRRKGQYLLLTGVLGGLTPLAMALPMELMSLPVALGSTVAMGATQGAFMALSGALVQAVAPDELRGRISSLHLLSAGGLMAWVNLANGALADVWHVPLLFLLPALAYLGVFAVLWATRAPLKTTFREGSLAPAPPLPAAALV